MHRGKKRLPSPETTGEGGLDRQLARISNSPLPPRPASRNDKRLAFVFALNYRLDCGSANGACRVIRRWRRTDPKQKNRLRKERGSQTRGLQHPRPSRSAATRTLSAHPSASKLLEAPRSPLHLTLTHHDILYSRYPEEHCFLPWTYIPSLLPHRNVTNHGTANPSRPRRVAALPSPTPTCYIASTARP